MRAAHRGPGERHCKFTKLLNYRRLTPQKVSYKFSKPPVSYGPSTEKNFK